MSKTLSRVNFSIPYCGSLPRWGSMYSGECFQQTMWGLSTNEKEFGLLPTPKAQDGVHPGVSAYKSGQTLHLSAAVMLATAPQTDCSDNIQGNLNKSFHLDTRRSPLGVPQVSLNVHLVVLMISAEFTVRKSSLSPFSG